MITINPPSSGTPPTRSIVAAIRDNARAHPDKLALVCGQTRLTWAAFDAQINRVANLLLGQGMQKGDRIAILSPNSAEYAVLF
ncbi:MAG: AMP-binding protein, partial [Paracoccaceae bacterium]|nr:AMP-binding protein [Paracoccaceae bacterium]